VKSNGADAVHFNVFDLHGISIEAIGGGATLAEDAAA
jgi:hypothetical protein